METKKPNPAKWQENVDAAKLIVASRKQNQMEIARLALEVCEITWGGRNNRYSEDAYTLTRFASEIGVNMKTLSQWVAIRKKIWNRVDIKIRSKLSYTECALLCKVVGHNATRQELNKEAEKFVAEDSFEHKMGRYLQHMKSIAYNFVRQGAADRCDKKTLEEFKLYALQISEACKRVKAKDNNLAQKRRPYGTGAAAVTFGGNKRSKRLGVKPLELG